MIEGRSVAGKVSLRLHRESFSLVLDFELPSCGVLGVYGPSGSGKTSLLRCLAGLENDVDGTIRMGDQYWLKDGCRQVPAHERRVGYVFQDARLFPHLSVEKNLRYGEHRQRANRSSMIDWQAVIELLDLAGLLSRQPANLSGGEQQRVAIGRALLSDPDLLLLDEPLASLDVARKGEVLPYLDRLHERLSIPMVYVSHHMAEIQHLCDELLVLRNGRKIYQGDVKGALVDAQTGLAHEQDAGALLGGEVARYDDGVGLSEVTLSDGQILRLPMPLNVGETVKARVLARDVSLCLDQPSRTTMLNVLRGSVGQVIDESAHQVTLSVRVADDVLLARVSRKSWQQLALAPGRELYVQFKAVSVDDAVHPALTGGQS